MSINRALLSPVSILDFSGAIGENTASAVLL
jgi:hypothetical protein